MGIKFYHKNIINIINKEFPFLLKGDMEEKHECKLNINIDKLSDPRITGSSDNEQKILMNTSKAILNGISYFQPFQWYVILL